MSLQFGHASCLFIFVHEITFSSIHSLKKGITFERVVVDVEIGRHKSIKRSLQEYGRENVKNERIAE